MLTNLSQYYLKGEYGRKIFTLGMIVPSLALLIGYSIYYIIAETRVPGSYKMVAIFLSTVIYSNILSSLFVLYLRKGA